MMLHITRFNQIYLSNILLRTNISLIIKRNVGGEVAKIVPKNMSSFSHQVLTLTGRGPLLTGNCGLPIRQGTVVCPRVITPYNPPKLKIHQRPIDFRPNFNDQELKNFHSDVTSLQKKYLEQAKGAPTTTEVTEKKEADISSQPSVNQITLINSKNEAYTTSITEQSTSDQFNKEDLLRELKIRALVKKNEDKTEVKILLKDGSSQVIGLSKNDVKLTPLGQAYEENLPQSPDTIYEQTSPYPKIKTTKLIISIPPASTDDTIVDGGKQKHLILAEDKENADYVIAIGYLTSKKTSTPLTDKQFKAFQNEKEGIISTKTHEKTQGVKLFEIPLRLKKEEIKEVAWDKEYLKTIPEKKLEYFLDKVAVNWVKGFKDFSNEALTKEQILQMCKDHDNIVKKNEEHPLTADQIKQNAENKLKQKEQAKIKQQEKTKNKLKQTLNNTEHPDKL